nr:hypothetical protein CFP56_11701 [Quercus suber]
MRRVLLLVIILTLSSILYFSNTNVLLTRLNQIHIEVERRLLWWNWKDTEEEVFCRAPHELPVPISRIPNVVHFILLAEEGEQAELSYAPYLAIKAAILRMNAVEIKIHSYGVNKPNALWKEIEDHVTLVYVDSKSIHGSHTLKDLRIPHQADILRLAILLREGGIYMDLDVYALKPLTDLLSNPRDTVMGHEGGNRYGLCNAVIVSRPDSDFIHKWEATYATFDPQVWNYHSVQQPKRLQAQFPDLICPLSPTVFFWPTWARKHVHYMHEPISLEEKATLQANMTAFGGAMYQNQLAFHAVASKEYLRELTPEIIQNKDTRFNILVRDIAAEPLGSILRRSTRKSSLPSEDAFLVCIQILTVIYSSTGMKPELMPSKASIILHSRSRHAMSYSPRGHPSSTNDLKRSMLLRIRGESSPRRSGNEDMSNEWRACSPLRRARLHRSLRYQRALLRAWAKSCSSWWIHGGILLHAHAMTALPAKLSYTSP